MAVEAKTHRGVDARLCGELVALFPGEARVRLQTVPEMGADDTGLVHGGFVFGLADHAAMLAVNEPTVVLAGAVVRFLRPSRVGDVLEARAGTTATRGRQHSVGVTVECDGVPVFQGTFECVVPDHHVLAPRG